MTILGSEPPVAQPPSKLIAIARTASRSVEHLALDVIGLLHNVEAFGEAAGTLTRTPEREQEQDNGEGNGSVVQRRPHPWARGDPGEEPADHRRPRFQSSRRA